MTPGRNDTQKETSLIQVYSLRKKKKEENPGFGTEGKKNPNPRFGIEGAFF